MTFSLVLMTYLNSGLVSVATVKNNEDFIEDLEDLPRFPNVRIITEREDTLSTLFTVSFAREIFVVP